MNNISIKANPFYHYIKVAAFYLFLFCFIKISLYYGQASDTLLYIVIMLFEVYSKTFFGNSRAISSSSSWIF